MVLALGGACWRRLGSDGSWAAMLRAAGIDVAPFKPSNFGLHIDWSEHMTRFFGQPVKAVQLEAEGVTTRGERVKPRPIGFPPEAPERPITG